MFKSPEAVDSALQDLDDDDRENVTISVDTDKGTVSLETI